MRRFARFAAPALLASAVAAPATTQSPTPPVQIPIEQFASLPLLRKPILSPDGHRVAARSDKDGKTIIVILNGDRPEQQIRSISVGKARIVSMAWAGSDRLLLTVRLTSKVAGGYEIPFLRLIAVDVGSGESRILDPNSRGTYAGDVLYTDSTGSWALVASQDDDYSYPSVKRVDLATGKAMRVEKPREHVWDWYADEQGVVRAGVAYEDRRWTVWYRDKPDEKLRVIRGKFDEDKDSAVDRFIFRGGNSWIVTNERTGRFGLYKYDLNAGAVGDTIYENPIADVDDVYYETGTGAIKAVEYEDDRKRIVWLAPDMKLLQEKLDRALPSAINLPVDWSTDENRVLVWSEGATDPGRYFLLDRKAGQMHVVVDPYPEIDPATLAPVQWVHYTARDGLQLSGYLTLPKGRDPNKLPLILMPHGGPFERDHWEYDVEVQFLANRGYAIFQPQFRGSTGFGKTLVSKGYGEWGRKMQDDLDDGVDWLAQTGQIDPKRVCIVGASYGGYAALWGAFRNPERYRCAASMAGVSDLPKMMRYDRRLFSATRYYRDWQSKVSGQNDVDLRTISPITFASQIKVPLLIAHGEEDENVPPSQSHAMVEALNAAHANVTAEFFPEGTHGWNKAEYLQRWLSQLQAFLAKYNPA